MTTWKQDSLNSSYFLDEKKGNGVELEPARRILIFVAEVLWNVHDQIVPTPRVHWGAVVGHKYMWDKAGFEGLNMYHHIH